MKIVIFVLTAHQSINFIIKIENLSNKVMADITTKFS